MDFVQVPSYDEKSVQIFRIAFFRSDFLQNPYFSRNRIYQCKVDTIFVSKQRMVFLFKHKVQYFV